MSKSSCEAIFFIVINYMPRDKKKLSKKQKKNPARRKVKRATRSRLSKEKEAETKRIRLSKEKKAATKIQSRLRGNMTRRKEDVPWTEPLLSVPYRDTDWKSTKGLEMP